MSQSDFRLIGRGLYSLTEASRLSRVPIRRIKRWTDGYWFILHGKRQWSPPVIGTEVGSIEGTTVLDFADLMEVRFLNALRDQGIGWAAIRVAGKRASDMLGTSRPFSSQRFTTDGHNILLLVADETGDRHLLNLVRNQWECEPLIELCRKGLHYEGKDQPQWWSPMGEERRVAVHPSRSFGAPIALPGSVRTRILYGAYKAEGSVEAAAEWYRVEKDEVADAVAFEEGLKGYRRAA
jgi:uncharacterized protein (DUF433 family)